MRDYGKVHSTFWSSPTTGSLSDDGKVLALYLLTCSHSTIAGVFRLPDGYVSEDLGWPLERVAQGFAELFEKGFANRCATTKWVWICKHLEWNKPENPNQRKSAAKIALSVPNECCWKLDFMRVCGPSLGVEAPPNANPSGTVDQPFLNQEQEQEQKQKQERNTPRPPKGGGRVDPAAEPDGFGEFWSVYPRKVGKDAARKAFAKRKPDRELLAKMLAAVAIQAKSAQWQRDSGQYIPHPSTWLNEGRWDDGEGAAQGGDSESRPQWALQAGFENRWEAENERCYAHNAHLFRDGRRMEVPD